MRNLILLGMALLSTVVVSAQEFDKEAVKKMSDEVCKCITGKEGIDTKEKAELEFGICLMSVYNGDKAYYDSKNMNFADTAVSMKAGEQVGMQLAGSCPAAMKIFMMIANDDMSNETDYEEEDEYIVITGTIIKTDDEKFNTFEIKDENGKKFKVLWLTYVDNDQLLEDAVKGKTDYIFTIMELDLYDPRIEEYRSMMILDKIEQK
jgi:hypothetical protein